MKLGRIWDRKQSPLPHLPWIFAMGFRAAPVEVSLQLAANVILGLTGGASLLITRRLVDALTAGAPRAEFLRLLAYLAAVAILMELGAAIQPVTNQFINEKTAIYVRARVLRKSGTLPLAAFDQTETYNLIDRATGVPGYTLANTIFQVYMIGQWVIRGASAIAIVGAASPAVAAGACLVAIPLGWAGARSGRRQFKLWREQTPAKRMSGYLAGLLSDRPAATELRAYQLLAFFLERWRRLFRQQSDERLAIKRRAAVEAWGAGLLGTGLYVGALALFTGQAGRGGLTAGAIVALAGAIRMLRESASFIATQFGIFWQTALPLLDLRSFLELDDGQRPTDAGLPFPAAPGAICLEHVSFSYPGKPEPVLSDISLTIHPGERVALVGANGAGKSTLIKLLLGLYTPTAGRITIGGVDLREMAEADLRRNVSCIFQDFVRYDMTVAENIAQGRPDATRPEVEAAARQAGADPFIRALPSGYDTMLGKAFPGGLELSGGQWQRIALARAFVRGARVLVLDEPTAALDARAELELFGKFVELAAGRTAILISHRLGVTRLADRIIVLDGGRVAEVGAHAELMAAGGLYADLFRTQAQWYEAEVAS